MKIVLIGAGRVATHLGRALHEAGHQILQVYSRTMESAQTLANTLQAEPVCEVTALHKQADVYIFSIKDSALVELISQICPTREDCLFLHTAGSMPMSVFEGKAHHYGVFYPMQTFTKNRPVDFREIPCFLEASDQQADTTLHALASSISQKLYQLSSDDRRYLHLAAVWASNFVNHCYDVASVQLESHGIPFSVMQPLIDETASKVHQLSPREAQTGPAVRYDQNVIRAQAELLAQEPALRQLYEQMSQSIHNFSEHD